MPLHLFSYFAENAILFKHEHRRFVRTTVRWSERAGGSGARGRDVMFMQERAAHGLCGIVVLVYGPLNLAAPYLYSYDIKHLFCGWHALLLDMPSLASQRRASGCNLSPERRHMCTSFVRGASMNRSFVRNVANAKFPTQRSLLHSVWSVTSQTIQAKSF